MGIFAAFPFLVAPYDPNQKFSPTRQPPSLKHLFGTDTLGRDLFSRCVWGTRTTLYIGFACVLIEFLIGLLVGGIAGYFGGVIDETLMRMADVVLGLPTLIMVIVAVSMFEQRSISILILVMGFLGWPWMARVIRSQFLSIKTTAYVEAAKAMGATDWRIIYRHILPNMISPVIVMMTLDSAGYILWEATLTFLGLGDPRAMSWGVIVTTGKTYIRSCPWISTFSGLMLFVLLLTLNMFGDGLRDVLDVRVER